MHDVDFHWGFIDDNNNDSWFYGVKRGNEIVEVYVSENHAERYYIDTNSLSLLKEFIENHSYILKIVLEHKEAYHKSLAKIQDVNSYFQ